MKLIFIYIVIRYVIYDIFNVSNMWYRFLGSTWINLFLVTIPIQPMARPDHSHNLYIHRNPSQLCHTCQHRLGQFSFLVVISQKSRVSLVSNIIQKRPAVDASKHRNSWYIMVFLDVSVVFLCISRVLNETPTVNGQPFWASVKKSGGHLPERVELCGESGRCSEIPEEDSSKKASARENWYTS